MAELNKNQLLLFALLMILPAHALDVIFSSALEDFKQKSEICINMVDGSTKYDGTLNPLTYRPQPDTCKVIVYIIDRSRFVEIVRNAVYGTIFQIAQELKKWHHELVILGIENLDDDEYHLISAFMVDKIQPYNDDYANFTIETIGENHFDRTFQCNVWEMSRYQENARICGGTLRAQLRSISRGALRPVKYDGKEIRLYALHPKHSSVGEVRWPVCVLNKTYFPGVNVSDPKYNFRIRFIKKKICLLILGGKEYSAVFTSREYSRLRRNIPSVLNAMKWNKEGLLILGAFNFDWTEIDIVTQIILKHSVAAESPDYNVFSYGYGMFNSYYLNEYVPDGRIIRHQQKSNVTELIKELMGEEVKERAINMRYSDDDGWKIREIPIILGNGRYLPIGEFINFIFPWVNRKIAFIVYDSTESNDPIDIRMVCQTVEELKQSDIHVVMIEAFNFGSSDIHIIAEWIDYHRGVYIQNADREVIDSEQIAVLGGGTFDTIFQSELTTYKTLFDTKKTELKRIRNAYVTKGNEKRIFVAKLEYYQPGIDLKFDVWLYSMNTVNGFYEPGLIPDKHMFDTTDGRNIFFINTSKNDFRRISRMNNVKSACSAFRRKMRQYFSMSKWSIFLVGLENFGERDYHLFAEFVKAQTRGERSLQECVRVVNYGDVGQAIYQYKDTAPLKSDDRSSIMQEHFSIHFG